MKGGGLKIMWSTGVSSKIQMLKRNRLGESTLGGAIVVLVRIRPFSGLSLSLLVLNKMRWKVKDSRGQQPVKEFLSFLYSSCKTIVRYYLDSFQLSAMG